jgi:hypothetical protein
MKRSAFKIPQIGCIAWADPYLVSYFTKGFTVQLLG